MGWLQTADYDILSLISDNTQEPVDTSCYKIMLLWGVFWDGAFNSLPMVPITLNKIPSFLTFSCLMQVLMQI